MPYLLIICIFGLLMNHIMAMFSTEETQIKMFGRKIEAMPDFRRELLADEHGFPIGVDASAADEFLRSAWEHSRALPHQMELMYRKRAEGIRGNRDTHDLLKRLGGSWLLEWYVVARPPAFRLQVHPISGSPGPIPEGLGIARVCAAWRALLYRVMPKPSEMEAEEPEIAGSPI